MPRLSKVGAAALAAFGWTSGASAVSASYLIVAGGGSGGAQEYGGGGGAGGYLTGTTSLSLTLSYTVTVGAGGAGIPNSPGGQGFNGSNSVFNAITTIGGGAGAGLTTTGASGGSGGGGVGTSNTAGGSGTAGQGNAGAAGSGSNTGGGGGGAGAAGSTKNGGVGLSSSISGTSTFYAGGAGAFAASGGGSGGNGGGGNAGASGTQNTGGGGGASISGAGSASGGSGVVIISYSGAQQFSGGVVTSVGGNTIHTFTTSGTLGPITTLSASYLIVAGGGGGGGRRGGGGGAGGLLTGSVTIDPNSTYLVTVGAGGAGGVGTTATDNTGSSGTNSAFSMVATSAVGGGAGDGDGEGAGLSGGSGGGGSGGSGGAGTSGQGNAGGSGSNSAPNYGGGGGGGASAVGSNGTTTAGGNGGAGTASSISGTSTTYAGGGGGGTYQGGTAGTGGAGGGGGGGTGGTDNNGTAGTANTGGGGGGGSIQADISNMAGGAGGSGVVIISYPGATQQMAGGTVTIVGGNVIHTFTSTGFLAPIELSTGSLRFRQNGNNAFLSRTPTVAGNRRKWTWSAWIKRGLSGDQKIFSGGTGSTATTYLQLYFGTGDVLRVSTYVADLITTTAVYRDYAAWYNIVWVVDTDNATTTNRMQLYVNGTLVATANVTGDLGVNQTQQHSISSNSLGAYGEQEMTEINFVDGQALPPTAFGTFNSYGVWQPITYGGSYGTNGFYLPFNRQAVSFVGSFSGSNYLTLASNTAFNIFNGDMTVECYFNANSLASSPHLFAFVQDSTNRESIYFNGSALTFYASSSAGSGNRIATATLSTGVWYHYALVKSGATFTAYLNGVAVGTSTTTQYSTANQSLQLGTYNNGGFAGDNFNGYMSNVRVVKGTAVYTSNFVPPTSALTAITNTQLLTLQNSSIVDNSANAFSITNTGTVTTGQTFPYAYGIFNDQGPAGNNWTPSGISGAFGSTLDYMGDAPTLTSATVANYATLNPLGNGSGTLSNANLTSTTSSTTPSVAGMAMQTGKWYWEVTLQTVSFPRIGVYDIGSAAPADLGATAYGWCILNAPSRTYNNGSAPNYGAFTPVSGTVVMLAYDADNGRLWYGQDGTWFASGNPATNANPSQTGVTGRAIVPAVASGGGSNVFNFNFGQQPFVYTPPSGYVALNTFNL